MMYRRSPSLQFPLLSILLLTPLQPPAFGRDPESQSPSLGGPSARDDRVTPSFAADEILIAFRDGFPYEPRELDDFAAGLGLHWRDSLDAIQVHRFQLEDSSCLPKLLRELPKDPRIRFAEPNAYRHPALVPNDPLYANAPFPTDLQRWVFDGIGLDRNLNAQDAWNISTGRGDTILAVVDSGVDLDHPDLVDNLWFNPGEVPGNSIDDDGNGFIDDLHGYDFFFDDADPNPDLGDGIDNDGVDGADSNVAHGTQVASIAGARGDNGFGICGASFNCQLMVLKVFTDDGPATDFGIASAILYAAQEGADVTNLSLEATAFSNTLADAIEFSWSQGVLHVASAGNGNQENPQIPASLPHVVSVGASDSGSIVNLGSGDLDGRASDSQFGADAVDVVAPGVHLAVASVTSTADGAPGTPIFDVASGTSLSASLVSGLALLMVSRARDLGIGLTNESLEVILERTAVDLPDDPGDVPDGGSTWDGSGRVDFASALDAIEEIPGDNAPTASAGPDQTSKIGATLKFDGTGSSDPDLDPLFYLWDFGDGSPLSRGALTSHSYTEPGNYEVTLRVDDGLLTDTDTLEITIRDTVPTFFATSKRPRKLGVGGEISNEDIFSSPIASPNPRLHFDGSDVGLNKVAIDAFTFLDDGDLLLSFNRRTSIRSLLGGPNGGFIVEDSDLVRFTPTQLGATTAGVFQFHFDGSDVGLDGEASDIDALFLHQGNLVISTRGPSTVPGIPKGIEDRDLLLFDSQSLGASTSGQFTMFFDGSDVFLDRPGEDLDGASLSSDGSFVFSTLGVLRVPGLTGSRNGLYRFVPSTLGETTEGSFEPFLVLHESLAHRLLDVSGLFLTE